MSGLIVHVEPLEIGGHTLVSEVPYGYVGPCAVFYDATDKVICAFPNYDEALRAAMYAIKPCGGYGSAAVRPCDAADITHTEFIDWM